MQLEAISHKSDIESLKFMKNWKLRLVAGLFIFGAGFLSAWILDSKAVLHFDNDITIKSISNEHRQGQYKLINPLLECNMGEEVLRDPLGVSKFKIENFVKQQLKTKNVSHISLYFRDLNNGPWLGVNSADEFIGASLMKVPLMIAYLKEAEDDPKLLEKKIRYTKLDDLVPQYQFFEPTQGLKLGNEYTIKELIEYLIKYSDNNASALLNKNIEPEKISNVFSALGIGLPNFNKPYPVSVRTYGAFFRILFNASYLNKKMSEYALKLLTQSEFEVGINDLLVAHKHGIQASEYGTEKQLHDCGIVYYPLHPYLICIMTRGSDFNKLSNVIQLISERIYYEVSTHQQ